MSEHIAFVEPFDSVNRVRGRILNCFHGVNLTRSGVRQIAQLLNVPELRFDLAEWVNLHGEPSPDNPLYIDDNGNETQPHCDPKHLRRTASTGIFAFTDIDSIAHRLLPAEGFDIPPLLQTDIEWSAWFDRCCERAGSAQRFDAILIKDPEFTQRIEASLEELPDDSRESIRESLRGALLRSRDSGQRSADGGASVGADSGRPAEQDGDRPHGGHSNRIQEGRESRGGDPDRGDLSPQLLRVGEGDVPEVFRLTQGELGTDRGLKTRAGTNIEVIRLLNSLNGRTPIEAEKEQLVEYMGWGGIPQIFDESKEDWKQLRDELKELVSEQEYGEMRASTLNAHYTSLPVIRAIYSSLEKAGYDGKGSALEAGCGVGHFIGCSPKGQSTEGIELDPITSQIADAVYRDATIHNASFDEFNTSDKQYDLTVGNPPFGAVPLYDPKHSDLSSQGIHNFFMTKSLRAVRPGGLGAFVVSRYFLDKLDDSARRKIHRMCDLVACTRLPETAFRENAGTDVVTDVLVFRKRMENEPIPMDADWLHTDEIVDPDTGTTHHINRKINSNNRSSILGEIAFEGSMYVSNSLTVKNTLNRSDQEGIGEALAKHLGAQCVGNHYHSLDQASAGVAQGEDDIPRDITSYFNAAQQACGGIVKHEDGNFYQYIHKSVRRTATKPDGSIVHIMVPSRRIEKIEFKNVIAKERLEALLEIKEDLLFLLDCESQIRFPDTKLRERRDELKASVLQFRRKFSGPYNSATNMTLMRNDVHGALVMSLWDDISNISDTQRPAEILFRRVTFPHRPEVQVETLEDAFALCRGETGTLDVDFCAEKLGQEAPAIAKELLDRGMAFWDPDTHELTAADEYLSGNIRKKLDLVERKIDQHPNLHTNLAALQKVLPEKLAPEDIQVQLSTSWVPGGVIEDFCNEVLELPISCLKASGATPRVEKHYSRYRHYHQMRNHDVYGTDRMGAVNILENLLQSRPIQIKDKVPDPFSPSGEKYIVNAEATARAQLKAGEMEEKFKDWIWSHTNRAERLVDIYHETFQSHVHRRYDGSHLHQLPGMAHKDISLRKHQLDGAWRMVCEKRTLVDHVVGAGKTYTGIVGEMEKKRLGKTTKSMVVVPNHLVPQWTKEAFKLYPHAKILTLDEKSTTKKNRQDFLARMAVSDWDFIICPASFLALIPVSTKSQKEFIRKKLQQLELQMEAVEKECRKDPSRNGLKRKSIKEFEKQKKELTKKLKETLNKHEDTSITWEQLGVDSLVVDEAQHFKNLPYETKQRGVGGMGTPTGAKKSLDLKIKIDLIDELTDGKGTVTFLTGTPIANSLCELHHMISYLAPERLEESGIHGFDAWLSNFAKIKQDFEVNLTGTGFVLSNRVRSFINLPELLDLYHSFADSVSQEEIDKWFRDVKKERSPTPTLKNGTPTLHVCTRSDETALGMEEVIQRLGRIKSTRVDPHEDNALKCLNDARKRALDMRIDYQDVPFDPNNRVEQAAKQVVQTFLDNKHRNGTQLVFCDMSTPKGRGGDARKDRQMLQKAADQGDMAATSALASLPIAIPSVENFSLYNELKARVLELAEGEMDESEFVFIHDAKTDVKKATLFDDMNSGRVKVLMGSTQKMGTGMNVQKRLVSITELDAPWTPDAMQQRAGRGLRPGNLFHDEDPNFEFEIHRYSTERTAAAKEYQTLETKAKFIADFRAGNMDDRVSDTLSDSQTMSFAQMKALSSGRPEILAEIKLQKEIKELEVAQRSHAQMVRRSEWRVRDLNVQIPVLREAIENTTTTIQNVEKYPSDCLDTSEGQVITTDLTQLEGETHAEFRTRESASRTHLDQVLKQSWNLSTREHGEHELGTFRGVLDLKLRSRPSVLEWVDNTCELVIAEVGGGRQLRRRMYKGDEIEKFSPQGMRRMANDVIEQLPDVLKGLQSEYTGGKQGRVEAEERIKTPFEDTERLEQMREDHKQLRLELGMSGDTSAAYQSDLPTFTLDSAGRAWDAKGNQVYMPPETSETPPISTQKALSHHLSGGDGTRVSP